MHLLRRSLTSLALVTTVLLSGCSSSVDGTAASGTATPGTDRLAAALSLVPAVAGSAEVSDLAAAKQRWGLGDVTSQTDLTSEQSVELRKKFAATGLGSRLMTYSVLMADAGWSAMDVDTEITPRVDGPPVTIYRLRSSLDMQQVIDSFRADGMKQSGADEAPFFKSADIGTGTFGRVFVSGVTVYPAQHLVVAGPQGAWTMPAPGASLAGVAGVSALVAGLPSADYVAIDTGALACVDPASDGRSTPDAVRKFLAALDAAGERQPVTGTLVAVTADDAGQIRVGYPDAAAAAADLPVRTKILQTIDSPVSRRPYSQLFTATISADGPVLRYAVSVERPAILVQIRQRRDTPWAYC